jgi:hypothetical protein
MDQDQNLVVPEYTTAGQEPTIQAHTLALVVVVAVPPMETSVAATGSVVPVVQEQILR